MSINIKQDYIRDVKAAIAQDKIALPFKAPSFWWKNGVANAVATAGSGAEHFGGWACNADDFVANIPPQDEYPIPAKFVLETWTNAAGDKKFDVYATRYLSLAVFASRSRWMTPQETGSDKGYGNTQWLAFCSIYDSAKKVFVPWSPVLITATSTKALYIKDALSQFDKLTAGVRAKFAGGAPIGFFYATIGTFGAERKTVLAGKGNNKSPVTRCELRAGEEITTEPQLEAIYVGDELAKLIADNVALAKDWLDEWKRGDKKVATQDTPVPPEPELYIDDLPPM